MAIWHFRVGFVPRQSLIDRYGTLPISLSDQDVTAHDFWREFKQQAELEEACGGFAPECSSWSPERRCWGEEEGSQLAAIYSGGRIEWLTAKLDVRTVSQTFLRGILEIASRFDLLPLAGGTYVCKPEVGEILQHLRTSTAARFLEDPERTLRSLPKAPSSIRKIDGKG